jgi:L-2,4-diaminobutyrate decarboxylase
MCLQVYSILKAHGKKTFIQNNEHLFDAARLLADLIKRRDGFDLLIEPQANIVNFRYIARGTSDLNNYTDKLRAQLINEGVFYIVSVMIDGQKYLRCSVMNPLTKEEHFEELLDNLERIGKSIAT